MHLLRLLPGSLPGRRDRRGAEFRIRRRDPRGTFLRQGKAAGERRSLGSRNCPRPRDRGALQMSGAAVTPTPTLPRLRGRGLIHVLAPLAPSPASGGGLGV